MFLYLYWSFFDLCRIGNGSGLPGDPVPGLWGSIPGPGRGVRKGSGGPPTPINKYVLYSSPDVRHDQYTEQADSVALTGPLRSRGCKPIMDRLMRPSVGMYVVLYLITRLRAFLPPRPAPRTRPPWPPRKMRHDWGQ